MRVSHPLLLVSLGVLFVAANCTLITDVDRSKIVDEMSAGGTSQAGQPSTPAGGDDKGGTSTGGTESMPGAGSPSDGGGASIGGEPGIGGEGVGGSAEAGASAGGATN